MSTVCNNGNFYVPIEKNVDPNLTKKYRATYLCSVKRRELHFSLNIFFQFVLKYKARHTGGNSYANFNSQPTLLANPSKE